MRRIAAKAAVLLALLASACGDESKPRLVVSAAASLTEALTSCSPGFSDAKVRLRLRLPGGRSDMDIDARVAWSDRRVGMGLQFERVSPADQQAINDFVDTHFFNNRRS